MSENYKNEESKKTEPKTSDRLYLERLKFDPELRKTWLNFFVVNFRVVILMIILISMWGIYSFMRLPRESNPEVKIPIAVVLTTYPGASPSDMEELVTKKIETGISGLKGIDKISSRSANSLSSVTVEFNASEDLEDSLRKLRDQVNNIKSDLPEDAAELDQLAVGKGFQWRGVPNPAAALKYFPDGLYGYPRLAAAGGGGYKAVAVPHRLNGFKLKGVGDELAGFGHADFRECAFKA